MLQISHCAWGDQEVCVPQDREQSTRMERLLYHLVVAQEKNHRAQVKWKLHKEFRQVLEVEDPDYFSGENVVHYLPWKQTLQREMKHLIEITVLSSRSVFYKEAVGGPYL